MQRIMFVCHGNICRSPMAEFIFKYLVKARGLENEFVIKSAATSDEEIYGGLGNPIYPPAKAEMTRRGIPFGIRRATQLKKTDYDNYDLFVGMDKANIRNMLGIFGVDKDKKVVKLLDYAGGGDVADPWYSGDFARAYDDIYRGASALLEKLTEQGG